MPQARKRPHLILWGMGDFGQKAAVFFLAMKAARGGALTIVVPRRDQGLFENAAPVVPDWRHFATVGEALAGAGQSVRVLYDDQTSILCRSVVEQRTTGSHLVVGYVTAGAADHLVVAQVLVELCDRVIVEKPLTNSLDDLDGFIKLDKRASDLRCLLVGAEHYLLRPAALRAGLHANLLGELGAGSEGRWLHDFLSNHGTCHLTYEFVFAEAGVAADATRRPGAFDDGAGLDVAVTHGLGALVKICSALEVTLQDIAAQPYTVLPWKAVDESGARVTASVAETAIELRWVIPETTSRGARTILLRSGKFFKRPDRYWRVFCSKSQACDVRRAWTEEPPGVWADLTGSENLLYGASLGPDGTTYVDVRKRAEAVGASPRDAILRRNEFGGYRSDRTDRQDPEAHNAQAALIETMFEPKLPEGDPRVLSIPEAVGITRIALAVQQAALGRPQRPYAVGGSAGDVFQLHAGATPRSAYCAAAPKEALRPTRATYRADEGGGRTELARVLATNMGSSTPIIDIPRHPTSTPDADALVASEIVTEIANAVGVAILPTADVERVLAAIPIPEEGRFNLVLNGIDRVPSREWPRVARVLDLVSPHVGAIAATTSHGGRSIGATVRAPEAVATVWLAHALGCDGEPIADAIAQASDGNIELARMIDAYWQHCSPEDYRKPGSAESVIAALCLPATLLPSTARQRLRVARAIVGEMDPAARAKLFTLAEVGGRVAVPKGSGPIEAGYSWIDAETCAIPSPIRHVLLSRDWLACEQVAADVRARLALLRDHARLSPTGGAAEAAGPERVAATERHVLVERLLRMPLGDIPFDGVFGALVLDLASAIDRKIAGFDKDCLAAQRLLKRLADPARGQEVALPPLLLARLSTMYARVSLDLAAMAIDVNDTTLLGAAALDRHTAAAFMAQWSARQMERRECPNAWRTHHHREKPVLDPADTVAYAYATLRMERIGCGGGRPRLIAKRSSTTIPIRVRPSRALWMEEGQGQNSPASLPWGLDWGRVVFDRILNEAVRDTRAFSSKTRAVLLRAGAWDQLVVEPTQPAAAGASDRATASGSMPMASPASSEPQPAQLLCCAAVAERAFARDTDKDCEYAEYAERAEAEAAFLATAPPQNLQQTRGASEVGRAYAEVLRTLVGGRLPAGDVTEKLRRLGLYGLLDTVDCLQRAWIPPTAQQPPPPANR